MEHSRLYKFLIVFIVVGIGLMGMFYLDSLRETSSLGRNMITGMAFSTNYPITEGVPASGGAAIDPKAGTVRISNMDPDTFVVDLVINPNAGLNYKYFKVSFVYVPIHLELINVGGPTIMETKDPVVEEFGFFNKVTIEGSSITLPTNFDRGGNPTNYKETSLSDGEQILLKLQFKPVVATPKVSQTDVMINSVSVKESESAPDNSAINQNSLEKGTIFFRYRCFNDKDGDGYGFGKTKTIDADEFCVNGDCCAFESGDCDDSTTDDPAECPKAIFDCYFGKTGNVIHDKYKDCAICINPGMIDPCDGVDNNCDNIIDGFIYEGEVCQEPIEGDCPLEECTNGLDDDGDNAIDEKDLDCRGHPGNCEDGKVIVWSYHPEEMITQEPGLIGCCEPSQCVDTVCTLGYTYVNGNKICMVAPMPPSFTLACYNEGEVSVDENQYVCGRHNHWIRCDESYQGRASDDGKLICMNVNGYYNWMPIENYMTGGDPFPNVECPEGPIIQDFFPSLTPACGNNVCEPFEHFISCPFDCLPEEYFVCPTYTEINLGEGCFTFTDDDSDKLPDEYEVFIDPTGDWFSPQSPDTDNDGIMDAKDYCPNTDTFGGVLHVNTGEITSYGCYSGDIATSGQGVSPDGCFTNKDITIALSYFNKNTDTCTTNLK